MRTEAIERVFAEQENFLDSWDAGPIEEARIALTKARAELAQIKDTLTFEAFRQANRSRCLRWHPDGIQSWSLSDWGVAASGEMGEALNVIKKLNRERDGLRGNTLSLAELKEALADEIADTAIYLDLLCEREGIDLGAAITRKFNRVSEKNGFPERLP